jgi:hypothetical protein
LHQFCEKAIIGTSVLFELSNYTNFVKKHITGTSALFELSDCTNFGRKLLQPPVRYLNLQIAQSL